MWPFPRPFCFLVCDIWSPFTGHLFTFSVPYLVLFSPFRSFSDPFSPFRSSLILFPVLLDPISVLFNPFRSLSVTFRSLFGPFSVLFGPFRSFSVLFGPFSVPFRSFSVLFGPFRSFSAISRTLNQRLLQFVLDILSKKQLGFVAGNRTSDAHLILHSLLQLYCHKRGQKVFSCFIDFRKAFDSIPRDVLFKKLLKIGISGKFFNSQQPENLISK